jgi:hypothetical protein
MRPIGAAVIANHSRLDAEKLSNAIENSDFKWQSNEEKAATLDNLTSLGILRRDTEIDERSYRPLGHRILQSVGMPPPGSLQVDVAIQTQDYHQLTIAGTAFVIACRPLNQRP